MEELEHDANSIIDLLTTTGARFSGVTEKLESCDPTEVSQWVVEALDLIYEGKAPPDKPDRDMCDDNNDDFVETLGASDGACMVTAVIAQWLLRFMCKKLMQLLTPESAILNRKYVIYILYSCCICYCFVCRCIPISYLETYLNYQTHFSLKELIQKKTEMLNQWYIVYSYIK